MNPVALREFLVRIGFKVNGSEERKFKETLEAATLRANLLAEAIIAASKAVVKAVSDMATGYEQLYYASQRTNTSIQNIKNLGYAVGQLGGSYEAAVTSLENFARQMRTNPGYGGLVRSLGVATEVNGKLRDSTDILTDLGKVFAGQKYYIGFQYAQALGIDEDTYRLLREQPAALKQYREEYNRLSRSFGVDSEAAGKSSVLFMQALRTLGTTVSLLVQRLLIELEPAITTIVRKFTDWVAANPDRINALMEQLVEVLKALGAILKEFASSGIETLRSIGETLRSWGQSDGVIGAIKDLVWYFQKFLDVARQVDKILEQVDAWLAKIDEYTDKGVGKMLEYFGFGKSSTPGASPSSMPGGGAGVGAIGGSSGLAPETASTTKEGVGARAKNWWKKNMPTWLGGDSPGGESTGAGAANPDAAKALGDAIAGTESGKASYNAVLGNGAYGTPSKPISEMTLAEAREFGRAVRRRHGSSSALGRYQIVNTTRDAAQKALGLGDDTPYNAETQDRMMRWIARNQGLGAWEGLKHSPSAMARARTAMQAGGARDAPAGSTATAQAPSGFTGPNPAPQVLKPESMGGVSPRTIAKMSETLNKYDFSRASMSSAPLGGNTNDNSITKSLSVNNRTEINVMGNSDPSATANAVGAAQNRVNRMTLNNAMGTMR